MTETFVQELQFGPWAEGVGTDSGTGLKRRLIQAVNGAPVFDPATLFAGSVAGAWYDPSDLTTLFQDSAGTTPITADGDPVGKVNDKSGNGNHLTSSGTARPLYKTLGGLKWLQFDGVDDGLATATSRTWAATSDCVLAVRSTGAQTVLVFDTASGSWVGSLKSADATAVCFNVGTPTDIVNGVTLATDNRGGLYTTINGIDALYEAQGAAIAFPALGLGNFPTFALAGRIYGLIVSSTANSAQRANVRTYLGAKAGLSL